LAKSYSDFVDKVHFDKDDWYSSRKLDGVRLLTVIDDNGNINFYSREGNEFTTLGVLKEELQGFGLKNITLDGELCIVDDEGKEDFKSAVSQIKRKDYTIENPKYKIFDILPTREFREGIYHRKFSERLQTMISFMLKFRPKHIETVRQIKVNSVDHLTEMSQYASDQGWEGLIIKRDIPYVAKRSNDMLKVKKFFEAEYEVIGIEIAPARTINVTTGLEETIDVMARANILHKGNVVGVGSGWTLDERKKYRDFPSLLVGKQVTVSYFEESQDKDGKMSLRFPTVKHIWEEGERDV
jgi:DNA ligase-1